MNKTELITALADQTGQTKAEATGTLDALLETIGATPATGHPRGPQAKAQGSLAGQGKNEIGRYQYPRPTPCPTRN